MKKVSIIIPIYNVEKYITKCLESIMKQTFSDFECILVNDGTKDNSVEVANEVIKDDPRFVVYDKENGGLSDARNFGLEKATGEYICFIDSDDYIDENYVQDMYILGKKYNSDVVVSDMMYVYDDGSTKISVGGYKENTNYNDDNNIIFINNSANNKLYKLEFLKDKRFIKGMWYEDLASVPVWIARANNVSYVNKPLYYYLQREGSISHSADSRIFDIYKSLEIIKNELNITSSDIKQLYYDNCLIMTTLRIRDIEDEKLRKEYYLTNANKLVEEFPNWYKELNRKEYGIKQLVLFLLLKYKLIFILNFIF